MRMKEICFAFLAACTIAVFQAQAATPAEQAKTASDAATASASKAAELAAQAHQKVDLLGKGIAELEATLKKLEAGEDKALLLKTQDELAKLKEVKAEAEKYMAKIDEASAAAAAAAAAAQDALARATAQGVSEADAQAAAGQALRQAKKADKALKTAEKNAGFLTQWIEKGGFGALVIDSRVNNLTTVTTTTTTTTSTTVTTTIPRPGPTPTQVGRGRRGTF